MPWLFRNLTENKQKKKIFPQPVKTQCMRINKFIFLPKLIELKLHANFSKIMEINLLTIKSYFISIFNKNLHSVKPIANYQTKSEFNTLMDTQKN